MRLARDLLKPLTVLAAVLLLAIPASAGGHDTLRLLKAGWDKPARTCKPHTRWWWPGNALTKADITWQLQQMAAQGMGGVEIMSTWKMYEKGNVEYLTPGFLDLVQHAVREAKRLDLEVAVTFSPGWGFGGSWVPQEDRSKVLCLGSRELSGGSRFDGGLPLPEFPGGPHAEARPPHPPGKLVAVVAGRIAGNGRLDADSLTVLTDRVPPAAGGLAWVAPPGRWRLMAFWLEYTGQQSSAQSFQPPPMVIDHLNPAAVRRYCEHLGGALQKAVGDEFGSTVDSLFCDSFEIHTLPDSLLWSDDTLAGFKSSTGYDLAKYLPALWFDIGPLTPRVRYDLGGVSEPSRAGGVLQDLQRLVRGPSRPGANPAPLPLHRGVGARRGLRRRGPRPKSPPAASSRLPTRARPRFPARGFTAAISCPPRPIPSSILRATAPICRISRSPPTPSCATALRRSTITATSPRPSRTWPPAAIFPGPTASATGTLGGSTITTWPQYVARCCFLLRQGRPVADVLIYSPQATVWSQRAIWESTRRVMPYGNLAKTLVANGYDFDIVNDDLLQHRAKFRNGQDRDQRSRLSHGDPAPHDRRADRNDAGHPRPCPSRRHGRGARPASADRRRAAEP